MDNLFDQDRIYWFCALAGSALFAIQFLLSLLGFSEGEDLGENGALDGLQIKWISKQTLTGFLMMFGWTALACKHEFELSLAQTIVLSLISGLAAVAISGLLFKGAGRLHSPGTLIDLDQSIGKEAIVYLRIPEQGTGKISVSIDSLVHEVDAVAIDGVAIESFRPVIISKKIDHKTLAVVPKR